MVSNFMVSKLKFLGIVLGLIVISSCESRVSNYESLLKENVQALDSLRKYINMKIESQNVPKDRFSLIFTADTQDLHINYYLYNSYIASQMKQLNIKEIRYDKTVCSFTKNFDTMFFQLKSDKLYPDKVVYFVYDSCDKKYNVKTNKIYQKSILKNWSVLIDASYPSSMKF